MPSNLSADWYCFRIWPRWILAPVLAALLLLTACNGSGDDTRPLPPQQARTTVLVYIVGSNLEDRQGSASDNIKEMMKVGSSQDANVILETGGSKKAGWNTVKRQRVVKGGVEVIADLGAQRMTDGANLRKFIEWGVATYPAQSYQLVLWNHGNGPLGGFGGDENYPMGKDNRITIPEMAAALEGAQRTTGVQIELIGFDACLMASAEVAYMLSPYARYLVASQDNEPGDGWDWEAYLRHVVDNPDSTAVSTGRAIVDGFVAKMERTGSTAVTLSLTDLSKMAALMQRLNDVAATLLEKLDDADLGRRHDAWAGLADARRYTHDFQTSWFFGGTYDLVDLADYVTMPKLGGLGVSEAQVDAVRQALEEAVIYNRFGRRLWATSGLTLYSPLVSVKRRGVMYRYTDHAALTVPDALKALVQGYGDIANSPDLPVPDLGPLQRTGGMVHAVLHNAKFSAAEYAALWQGDNRLAVKPLDADMPPAVPGERRIAAQANDGWFVIPSKDGAQILVSVLPDDIPRYAVGHAQYSVPVAREDPVFGGTSPGLLVVNYEEDLNGDKTYRIISFLGSDDASPYASRTDSQSLPADTVFYPMVWTEDERWDEDTSRKIVSYAAGAEDAPRDEWWQLKTVAVPTVCSGDCKVGLGLIQFQGDVVQGDLDTP